MSREELEDVVAETAGRDSQSGISPATGSTE